MRKIWTNAGIAAGTAAALLMTASVSTAATTGCVVGVSPGKELNLRAGPGKRFQVVGGFDADTCGVVIDADCFNGFCRVVKDDESGWASSGFLRRGAVPKDVKALQWVPLGSRIVSFAAERDAIELSVKDGRFRAIQLLARDNDIYMFEVRVIYGNGQAETIPVRDEIQAGRRSKVLDLAGRARVIDRVELIYRSDRSGRRRAKVELFGIAYRPAAKPRVMRQQVRVVTPPVLEWEFLGTQSVQKKDVDVDRVKVGRRAGQYRAIQLAVRRSDIEFKDLKIVYGNGRVQDVPIRAMLRAGSTSRVIDLIGEDRFLKEIVFAYSRRVDGYQRAVVDVYGLSVDTDYDRKAFSSAKVSRTGTTSAHTEVGILNCEVSGGIGFVIGSSKALTCRFNRPGRDERYFGTIDKFGLDVGATTQGVLSWAVLARTSDIPPGALVGQYAGFSGQATLGVGVGANALVGGSDRSVVLQPVSVQAQIGVNLAVGVAQLNLRR